MIFSSATDIIIWYLLVYWYNTFIDFQMLINFAYLEYLIMVYNYFHILLNQFDNILLRIFAFIFMRGIHL